MGDGSGAYIECDNEDCSVRWYHWECVQVTKEPVGTWLCPSCSPNATFYIKQLMKERKASPSVPNPGKAATPNSSKSRKAATSTPSKGKGQESGATKKEVVKKGPAIKKPKPRWVGWVQLSANEEEDYKRKVNAKFTMEDGVQGKRTRASKVAAEENETGSHRLRTRSIPEQKTNKQADVDSDSDDEEATNEDKYLYNEEEEEEEKHASAVEEASENEDASSSEDASMYNKASINDDASVHEEAPVRDDEPLSQDEEEDSMEIDEESPNEEEDSVDKLSDHAFELDEEHSDVSADLGEHGSAAGQLPGNVDESGSDEVDSPSSSAASSSSHSEVQPTIPSSPTSDSPLDATAAQQGHASPASPTSEDSMEVDAEDEDHVVVTVHPAVESNNYAALYQHKGNYWGEHPESAIRSTLPRLG